MMTLCRITSMGWYSQQALTILRVFLDTPTRELSGADIMREAVLLSGTAYPILARFEKLGLLVSHWEQENPRDLGRPRRRLYSLTAEGSVEARRLLGQVSLPRWAADSLAKA
jgi:PadR family transcriptional regulator